LQQCTTLFFEFLYRLLVFVCPYFHEFNAENSKTPNISFIIIIIT
jgi:hypothetical protein